MVVIIGHARLEAAKQLGLETVPVNVATDLTPQQVQALRLADNRIHEDGKWDERLLSLELADLRDEDFDLAKTGFNSDELEELLSDEVEKGPNVYEVNTGAVQDRFWISVRGPLPDQAKALQRLQDAMSDLRDVDVELGTTQLDL